MADYEEALFRPLFGHVTRNSNPVVSGLTPLIKDYRIERCNALTKRTKLQNNIFHYNKLVPVFENQVRL